MKVLTMYLPQFHRVKENDDWWGDGFTDWVTVQKALPLFEGHNQPRKPLEDNYYDLLQKKSFQWQAALMHDYDVDGMCIYHYWFKDGRQILEKPVEKLLQWKDIDMPFCFCWANETWARSWSNLSAKNAWADAYEKKNDYCNSGILLEQQYGNEVDWKVHFEYLLPYLQDSRYIKVENRPVFVIYRPAQISRLDEMVSLWNALAVQNGFDGIYFIGAHASKIPDGILNAKYVIEPASSIGDIPPKAKNNVKCIDYSELWDKLLSNIEEGERVYYGGFVGFDDTPRRGNRGTVVENGSPHLFRKYLEQLMLKNYKMGNEFVFLNAWNEWGEGMYLEPDSICKHQYLEQIARAKKEFQKANQTYSVQKKARIDKNILYLQYLHKWMKLRERQKSMAEYCHKNGFRSIAIYGYGIFAEHLIAELQGTEVEIVGIIDQNKSNLQVEYPSYDLGDTLPKSDVVIVCSFYYYSDIFETLKKRGVERIVSIDCLIDEFV